MSVPERFPSLIAALRLGRRELVAFVGSAGAVPVMLELSRQAEAAGRNSRVGTTTSVDAADVAGLRSFLYERSVDGRLVGSPPEDFDRLMRLGWVEIAGVFASDPTDRSVAVPGDGDPVIPRATTHVAAVIDADALDAVIEDVGNRPLRIAALVGCRTYERLTPERAARLLVHERGGRKGVPPMARSSVVITGIRDDHTDRVDRLVAELREYDASMPVVRIAAGLGGDAPRRAGLDADQ